MSERSVADRVVGIFAEFKKLEPSKVDREATFDDLGFDSLDGLNLIFELEEEFDIIVPDEKARSMRSVAEVIGGIESLIAAKEAA
ncbi:MAG: acyl carrier protein [Blastocatellia bacterium]|nr:acyl carrier protein [Chloracidobacterium sp.]MBL8185748.1 acyl carrier protein [Blastocatellia bacterium]HBE83135.1 phosphopantetheine-binding protein [Blastocatellia bacterium]HRJ89811.1 phosphopantetheine-binding protein [Pyrinomonadaceae bacterium]HRK51008.1 phosphopantetheine-binding protein [Pyrinomonadaceae bacterium]